MWHLAGDTMLLFLVLWIPNDSFHAAQPNLGNYKNPDKCNRKMTRQTSLYLPCPHKAVKRRLLARLDHVIKDYKHDLICHPSSLPGQRGESERALRTPAPWPRWPLQRAVLLVVEEWRVCFCHTSREEEKVCLKHQALEQQLSRLLDSWKVAVRSASQP